MKKSLKIYKGLWLASIVFIAQSTFAAYDSGVNNRPFDFFTDTANGWSQFADDDATIGPGGGGQAFDTEYLFYKYTEGSGGSSSTLSIGLQTGFDVKDGNYGNYYAGDLALSFDGSTGGALNGYEYAVDFGLVTKDYALNPVNDGANSDGLDAAGLYKVSSWNNDILFGSSSPFAMDEGTIIAGALTENYAGSGYSDGNDSYGSNWGYKNDKSYYRIVTFDLDNIANLSQTFTVDAHWTMSCGNDAINGNFSVTQNGGGKPVPEPSVLALLSIGSLSMIFTGIRRRKLKI